MHSFKSLCMVFAAGFFLLYSCRPCKPQVCNKTPRTLSGPITFKLKNQASNTDILPAVAGQPVPDSIRLKDLRTGAFFQLRISAIQGESLIYSTQYNRPANVTDSLVFYFGNSQPDTFIVMTALIDGWRGDECGTVKDVGINRVLLRNQVLLQTTTDDAIFTIRK